MRFLFQLFQAAFDSCNIAGISARVTLSEFSVSAQVLVEVGVGFFDPVLAVT
jgi:hypothetical protein